MFLQTSRLFAQRLSLFPKVNPSANSSIKLFTKNQNNLFSTFTKINKYHQFRGNVAAVRKPLNSSFGSYYGVALGLFGFATLTFVKPPLLNDATGAANVYASNAAYDLKTATNTHGPNYDKAFNGKLNYQELALGSMLGVGLGIVAGKLSSVLVLLSFVSYLTFQFLHSRGIVTVPFTRIIKIGSNSIDLRQMFLEQPSFNITFLASFLIAAYNI